MQSCLLRSSVNPYTYHYHYFSSHFLFNLFPFGFHSITHQHHFVQVTSDRQFAKSCSCFSTLTLLVFSASLTKLTASSTWMTLVTSYSPCSLSCFPDAPSQNFFFLAGFSCFTPTPIVGVSLILDWVPE